MREGDAGDDLGKCRFGGDERGVEAGQRRLAHTSAVVIQKHRLST